MRVDQMQSQASNDPVRLSMVGQIVRRRWRLLAALTVAGALFGAGASLLLSPGYQTSSNVLLHGPREESELLTEAQIAKSSVVLDRAAAALTWARAAELRDAVSAKVADGNVIKISAIADTPERAQELADQVAQEYVAFSTQLLSNTADASAQVLQEQREALRRQVAQTNERITELHGTAGQDVTVESVQARTQLEALRTALNRAMTRLDEAEAASGRANLVVLGPAERPTSQAAPTPRQLVAGGAALFLVLGVFGHLATARADRRLRTESEIGAALGSPIQASVRVPDDPSDGRSWIRRLLLDDRPWNVPELPAADDERGRDVRYGRILARIRGGSHTSMRVLVLTADDDAVAHRAAAQLAAAAQDVGGPAIRVVGTSAARPTVPDDPGAAGVLVVLTAGTRTAWELVAIAGACTDAGHDVLGVVVAHRARPSGSNQATGPGVRVDRDAMAGSA